MTSDQKWGTGKRIAHDTDLVNGKELNGQNKLGEILVKIKSEFDIKQRLIPAALEPVAPSESQEVLPESTESSVSPNRRVSRKKLTESQTQARETENGWSQTTDAEAPDQ